MDIVVTGRHLTVSDRFRDHIAEKLAKVTQLAPRTRRVEVMVSHEPNRRQAKACDRVEVTCYATGPVVRAEACADDKYAALDVVLDKLMERLRRQRDRRQVHRGRRTPESVAMATARIQEPSAADDASAGETDAPFGDSPIEVREKVHRSSPDDPLRGPRRDGVGRVTTSTSSTTSRPTARAWSTGAGGGPTVSCTSTSTAPARRSRWPHPEPDAGRGRWDPCAGPDTMTLWWRT